MIRIEAIGLLVGRIQQTLRLEELLANYTRDSVSPCTRHLCCAPQFLGASLAAFTPLYCAASATLYHLKKV